MAENRPYDAKLLTRAQLILDIDGDAIARGTGRVEACAACLAPTSRWRALPGSCAVWRSYRYKLAIPSKPVKSIVILFGVELND